MYLKRLENWIDSIVMSKEIPRFYRTIFTFLVIVLWLAAIVVLIAGLLGILVLLYSLWVAYPLVLWILIPLLIIIKISWDITEV